MYITQEKIYCVDPQHGRLQLYRGCKPRIPGKMPKYFPTIFEHFKSYFKGDNFSMLDTVTTLQVKIFVQWPFSDQLFGFSHQGKFLGAKLY